MKITLFNAGNGDCILIQSASTNILIDGGTSSSFEHWYPEIKRLDKLDAIFITHIDNDHTNGIIRLLEQNKQEEVPLEIKNIYFNGIKQLFSEEYSERDEDNVSNDKFDAIKASFEEIIGQEEIGFSEGTSLSYILKEENTNSTLIHNKTFQEPLLIGDFSIDIISPTLSSLNELKSLWKDILRERQVKKKVLTKNHTDAFETYINSLNNQLTTDYEVSGNNYSTIDEYASSVYEKDSSLANETSFSLLMKCDGKSFLMLGDAHIETILDWIGNERLSVDAVKVSHHGSKHNIKKEFLELLNCNNYLISTNGKKHKHPDLETLSRIAKFSKKESTNILINNNIADITDEIVDMFKNYTKSTVITMEAKEIYL